MLKNGKSCVNHKERGQKQMSVIKARRLLTNPFHELVHNSGCALSKCVRSERTPTHSDTQTQSTNLHNDLNTYDRSFYKENPVVHESPIQTSNRFDMLASMGDLQNDNYQEMTCDTLQTIFKGNKNKTGPILGRSRHRKNPDVHVSKILEGNKNKTGKKLGDVTRDLHHDLNYIQKACLPLRGNKNGIGAKLGALPSHDSYDVQMTESTVTNISNYSCTEMVTDMAKENACHELACMQNKNTDETVMLYDISNPGCKRRWNIPNFIHLNKHTSADYQNCIQQNGRQFGFLPLNDLMVYTGEDIIWTDVPNVIEAHKIIKKSARPNFMGVRIPVNSQFNIPAWESYLNEYWDKQIVDLLQYGFPLDFDRTRCLSSTYNNHTSAVTFPDHVNNYINTETKYGAILGPFDEYPFPCHVSPFLTREKPNSNNRRVILDLSFTVGQSVNDEVAKDKYLLSSELSIS